MMKTVRILALILIGFLLLPSVVMNADVIFEPENDFYEQHESQMVDLNRVFIANGEDGYAAVREAPEAKGETYRLQNGKKTFLYYSCLYDGDYWGFSNDGWIQMDQLLVVYDFISFEEDHIDELYLYKGDYEKIKETNSAIVWLWPGAVDDPLWMFDYKDTENFNVDYAYTDSQGREWGFAENLHGYGNIWVCLSDPLNSDIRAFNRAPDPMPWAANNVHTEINASENTMLWLIVGLVVVLVAGTAVLIKVFWKPRKAEQRGQNHS